MRSNCYQYAVVGSIGPIYMLVQHFGNKPTQIVNVVVDALHRFFAGFHNACSQIDLLALNEKSGIFFRIQLLICLVVPFSALFIVAFFVHALCNEQFESRYCIFYIF